MDPHLARNVVIRHVCHCVELARQAREEGKSLCEPSGHKPDEHVFTVDGEDFPWYISERGPLVTRLCDDLYTVDVELFGIDRETMKSLDFSYSDEGRSSVPFVPVIGGRKFPWTLAADEVVLRFGHKILPTLQLKFLALNVDAEGIEIDDQRETWNERAIYRAGGDLIRRGKDHCYYCNQWVDDMWDHYRSRHPQKRGVRASQPG
jgi:hypothetical protein